MTGFYALSGKGGRFTCLLFTKKSYLIPLLIAFSSFIINLIYILELRKSPLFYSPQMDALYHIEWAERIISGDIIGKEVFFRAPFYPYLLALIIKIFNGNLFFMRIFQGLIGSLSVFLIYLTAEKFFSKKVALFSSIVATLYGPFIYFTGEFLIVSLIIFLNLLIFLALYRAIKNPSFFNWLLAGVLSGLSAIARPNILLPALLLPILLFFLYRKNTLKKTIGLFCGILIVVSPILLRNYIVGKDFVPIASQAGINFYIGNNPSSDGTTAIAPGTRGTWWGGYHDAIRQAEKAMGKKLKPSEVSNYWLKKGLKFIKDSPNLYIKLLVKKFFLFFSGMEISNNKDIYFFKEYSIISNLLIWKIVIPKTKNIPFFIFGFPFSLLLVFAITGIIFSIKEKDKEKLLLLFFIITYLISVIIFFVNARYRMPVIPLLIMFSVFGFIELLKRKNKPYFFIPIIVFLIFNINLPKFAPPGKAQSFYNIGIAYAKKQQFNKALKYYKKAADEDSLLYNVYVNIGNVYARFNYDTDAEKSYKRAIEINPKYEKAYFNLGHLSLKKQEFSEAYSYYKKAFSLDPDYYLAYFYAGIVKERMGESEIANEFYKKCLSINRDFIPAKKKLSQ